MKQIIAIGLCATCMTGSGVYYHNDRSQLVTNQQVREQKVMQANAAIPAALIAAGVNVFMWGNRGWERLTPEQRKKVREAALDVIDKGLEVYQQSKQWREFDERQRQYKAARDKLAWQINRGDAQRAINETPIPSDWLRDGVNRAAKSDIWQSPSVRPEQSSSQSRGGANDNLTAPRFESWMTEPKINRQLTAPRMDTIDRRIYDPRPISGGNTYGRFHRQLPDYRNTFTKPSVYTRQYNDAARSTSENRGGREARDNSPSRNESVKETQSWRDRLMEIRSSRND